MKNILGLLLMIVAANATVIKPNFQEHENVELTELTALMEYEQYARERDPEEYLSAPEIIRYHGYPSEEHEVVTEDGYILTIQRIPYGKNDKAGGPSRPPVIVQHGLLCSSAIWVVNTPDKNLGYILADAGYDVWLTNVRGNFYGKKHSRLSVNSDAFWEFSFDQMAKYDLPALIDFVLGKTGHNQSYYIGHSMGTTIPFAMLSTKPEYNSKIRALMALAPVATVTHVKSPIRVLAPFSTGLAFLLDILGVREFLDNSEIIKLLSTTVCRWPTKVLCSSVVFILCGVDIQQLNQTRLPVYTHHIPAGTSVRNVQHFAQMIKARNFQQFDYGFIKNLKHYGKLHPPKYDVSKITTPIALFHSDNDLLADPKDVEALALKLKNLVYSYRVPYAAFSHLDFMWAIDVKQLLYDKVLEVMKKY